MLSPIRPTDAQLRDLLARSRGLPLSYPDVGATSGGPPAGYVRDHHRALLAVSGAAILLPMGLAWLYALGAYRHAVWIDIAAMFRYHGTVNALGFALPGLLAWHIAPGPGRGIDR